jgi:hypothetical protein
VTAPLSRIGACCASGNVRRDPWTGEERCQHCGLPVPLPNVAGAALHGRESPDVPPVLGGQGREPDELVSDAYGLLGTVALFAFVIAAFVIAAWAAGGGR